MSIRTQKELKLSRLINHINTDKCGTVPSLVRTDDSGEAGVTLGRGLLGRGSGKEWGGGVDAGSIFHGDTLSGRAIEDVSSHRT